LKDVCIGIVAGETSGDILGAGLMGAIKESIPNARFVGIGGPLMKAQGCNSLFPMERLSVMGFTEVITRLIEIIGIRKKLLRYFKNNPPDIFIGVDAPDFNLPVEKKLKSFGVSAVHYVSPSVWAWRGYRVRRIRDAVDHVLTLFPFEAVFYQQHNIPVTFVGHPMAEKIERNPDKRAYRRKLGIDSDAMVVALLPGSRAGELARHSRLFWETALWINQRHPEYYFIVPFVNDRLKEIFHLAGSGLDRHGISLLEIDGKSHDAMAAADVVLLASGTAALEAALLSRAMVVTYKVSAITAWLVRRFLHVKLFSLPNNLAGKELVPEFIQEKATVENLGIAIEKLLMDNDLRQTTESELGKIHDMLKKGASHGAAEVIINILSQQQDKLEQTA